MLEGPDKGNFRFLTLQSVVSAETVRAVVQALSLRGWQIADRWAATDPGKVKSLEADGTLIPRLKEQQTLEAETISDARVAGRMADVPDSEILALLEIHPGPSTKSDESRKPSTVEPSEFNLQEWTKAVAKEIAENLNRNVLRDNPD